MTFLTTIVNMERIYGKNRFYWHLTRDAWENSKEWSEHNKYVDVLVVNRTISLHALDELTLEDMNADDWREYTTWRNK